jgi:hypothetical protein
MAVHPVVKYSLGFVGIALLAVSMYFTWKHVIQAETTAAWNSKQLAIQAEVQAKYAADVKAMADSLVGIRVDLQKNRDELADKIDDINKSLDTPEAVAEEKKSGLSSQVLRDTVKKLGGQK